MDVGVATSAGVGQLPSGVGRKERTPAGDQIATGKPNHVGTVLLYGIPIVSLVIESLERLCLAQISNTLLKDFSYNEIHNRRVALGITCVQCTPVQLEILRRAGAMPVSSRRCGMITRREADRLCKSFLGDNAPPRLPEDFAFTVHHECAWGCRGSFLPARYNSSRAKCIKCQLCGLFFSPNKFIFHSHRTGPAAKYVQPDAANFNSWRRHLKLSGAPPDEVVHAWEDVKAMFNGGTRKRLLGSSASSQQTSTPTPAKVAKHQESSPPPAIIQFPLTSTPHPTPRVPPFPDLTLPLSRSLVMDYVWHHTGAMKHQFPFPPYGAIPWLGKRGPLLGFPPPDPLLAPVGAATALGQERLYTSAFRPVFPALPRADEDEGRQEGDACSDEEAVVDIETTEEETPTQDAGVGVATPWSLHREHDVDQGSSIDIKPNPEGLGKQESSEERLWTVARLSLERQDRAFYRQEMARQLHIMRELATPTNSDQFYSLGGPMSPNCHPPDRRNAGKFKDPQHGAKMALDCSTCHQLYTSNSSNNNNSSSGAVAGSDAKITH